jgi:hypothetical protein
MTVLSILSSSAWFIVFVVGFFTLSTAMRIASARAKLRAIERSLISDPRVHFHEDIEVDRVPKALRSLIADNQIDLDAGGFTYLLSGRSMRLEAGRSNMYYVVFVSLDTATLAQFVHLRAPRYLGGWSLPLFLSRWLGPTTCCYTLESVFVGGTTLITATDPRLTTSDLSFMRGNLVTSPATLSGCWQSHDQERLQLAQQLGEEPLLFTDRDAFFHKEYMQRLRIAEKQTRDYQQLREDISADTWDLNG